MPKNERSTGDRQMHFAKLQEKKDKLSIALVDYTKAYDMVSHLRIISAMVMVGLADNIIGLIKQSMNKWKTNLYADGKLLGSVAIRRGTFQGDSFSPLPFEIALLPLTHILRKTGIGYQLEKTGAKVILHGRLKTVWEQRNRKMTKTKKTLVNEENLFLALNTWAISLI